MPLIPNDVIAKFPVGVSLELDPETSQKIRIFSQVLQKGFVCAKKGLALFEIDRNTRSTELNEKLGFLFQSDPVALSMYHRFPLIDPSNHEIPSEVGEHLAEVETIMVEFSNALIAGFVAEDLQKRHNMAKDEYDALQFVLRDPYRAVKITGYSFGDVDG